MKKFIKYFLRKIETFFLWSSGADLNVLQQVPMEKNKFLGIGGTIIFTALMASFAGGYAFFTAFKNVGLAILFGLFWGGLIYNLDRFIVSTFGSGDGRRSISKQELIEASPRLVLAIILGFVISTPLELKIFEKEIKVRVDRLKIEKKEELKSSDTTFFNLLDSKKNELTKIKSDLNKYTSEKGQLVENNVKFLDQRKTELIQDRNSQNAETQKAKSLRDGARENYNKARRDSLPSSIISSRRNTLGNYESTYQIESGKRNKLDQDIIDLQNNKQQALLAESNRIDGEIQNLGSLRNNLQIEIADLEKTARKKYENYEATAADYDGFAAHLEAMDSLTKEKSILLYVKWLITLLFILIEIAPILFKMMTERGPYDDILDRMKHEYRVRQLEMQSNINQEINTAVRVHTDKYEQKLNAELQANKGLLEAISKAQQEIALVAIDKWKEEQKKKMKEDGSNIITSSV
jgi:hypothetical protein